MPDLVAVTGTGIDSIIAIDDVARGDIVLITGQAPPPPRAKRWMAGSRLGHIWTTSASNGDTGWNQGAGTVRGTGYIADIGDGQANSVGYGYVDPAGDPLVERWIFGCENIGSSGSTPYINSQSCQPADLDGAGRPTYATESNWVSGSGNGANLGYISNGQMMYGNGVWVRGGKWLIDGAERHVIGRSTDGGNTFTMIDMNNEIADYCRAVGYEGGISGNWLAVVQTHVWKSVDNGATWTDLGELETAEGGPQDFYTMAYDGAGRWIIAGAAGYGYTSITPIADMTAEDLEDQWISLGPDAGTSFDTNQNLFGLVYMKGSVNKWVVCGGSGIIKTYAYTSSNSDPGNKWTNVTTPGVTTTLRDIATDHTTIVVVGESGVIFAGPDPADMEQLNKTNDGVGTERLNCISSDIIGAGKIND